MYTGAIENEVWCRHLESLLYLPVYNYIHTFTENSSSVVVSHSLPDMLECTMKMCKYILEL